jgi:DNA-binding NtrC family response regulator
MASVSPSICPATVLVRPRIKMSMPRHMRALVVSPELEMRKALLRALEELRVDITVCSERAQAEQILNRESFDVVFCDEELPDGTYSDLVQTTQHDEKIPRVVVTTLRGDWDLYFDALGKGAFDVIRCPCYSGDVKMTILRVLHEDEAQFDQEPV